MFPEIGYIFPASTRHGLSTARRISLLLTPTQASQCFLPIIPAEATARLSTFRPSRVSFRQPTDLPGVQTTQFVLRHSSTTSASMPFHLASALPTHHPRTKLSANSTASSMTSLAQRTPLVRASLRAVHAVRFALASSAESIISRASHLALAHLTTNPMRPETPNHALQRTAPRVTGAAISSSNPSRPSVALSYVRCPSLRSTTQLPRHAPPSLSLGSLGHSTRLPLMRASERHSRLTRLSSIGACGVRSSASQTIVSFSRLSVRPRLTESCFPSFLRAVRFTVASVRSQVAPASPVCSAVIGRGFAEQSTNAEWPNHALQRTAPCVTVAASTTAFPPTTQLPRRTPLSLSLRSLGVSTHAL